MYTTHLSHIATGYWGLVFWHLKIILLQCWIGYYIKHYPRMVLRCVRPVSSLIGKVSFELKLWTLVGIATPSTESENVTTAKKCYCWFAAITFCRLFRFNLNIGLDFLIRADSYYCDWAQIRWFIAISWRPLSTKPPLFSLYLIKLIANEGKMKPLKRQ